MCLLFAKALTPCLCGVTRPRRPLGTVAIITHRLVVVADLWEEVDKRGGKSNEWWLLMMMMMMMMMKMMMMMMMMMMVIMVIMVIMVMVMVIMMRKRRSIVGRRWRRQGEGGVSTFNPYAFCPWLRHCNVISPQDASENLMWPAACLIKEALVSWHIAFNGAQQALNGLQVADVIALMGVLRSI